MQLRYVFSELGQGLRRNLSMHIAVVLTLFVSLTLVGLGVLLNQQADKAAEHWGSQLQITVVPLQRASDDNPACTGEVTDAQKAAIEKVVKDNPEVADYRFESKAGGVREGQGAARPASSSRARTRRPPPRTCPSRCGSRSRTPTSTRASRAPSSASTASPHIRDHARDRSARSTLASTRCSRARIGTALFLVLAALLLVGNTIRLAAFARRREIGDHAAGRAPRRSTSRCRSCWRRW